MTITMQLSPDEATLIQQLRAGQTPGITAVHLIAEQPGERGAGICPSSIDITLVVTDEHMFAEAGAREEFERELARLLAAWLDCLPRQIVSAARLAECDRLEAEDVAREDLREDQPAHDPAYWRERMTDVIGKDDES